MDYLDAALIRIIEQAEGLMATKTVTTTQTPAPPKTSPQSTPVPKR